MDKKLRILATGDLHGDSDFVYLLKERIKLEKPSILVISGDIVSSEGSFDNIIGPIRKYVDDILLIPGNHERNAIIDFLARKYDAKNLHGDFFVKQNIAFLGVGSANVGLFQLTENEIYEKLSQAYEKLKESNSKIDKLVLVSHVHPSDSDTEKLSGFKGSAGLKGMITKLKPSLVIFSHIHEASGLEQKIGDTRMINVAKDIKLIEL